MVLGKGLGNGDVKGFLDGLAGEDSGGFAYKVMGIGANQQNVIGILGSQIYIVGDGDNGFTFFKLEFFEEVVDTDLMLKVEETGGFIEQ